MTPTIWPARKVGDEYRCGRIVGGRKQCPGVIALVDDMQPEKRARYEPGSVVHELPGWDDDLDGIANQTGILHLRNTRRSRIRRHVPPGMKGSTYGIRWPVADLPFTRKCPVCRALLKQPDPIQPSGVGDPR